MSDKDLIERLWREAYYVKPLSKGAYEALTDAADALEAAASERDAALELMNRHKCDEAAEEAYRRVEKLRARVSELEQRDGQQWPELVKADAERDAAVAAIERVRAIHWVAVEWDGEKTCTCGVLDCPTVAALDGAPEPEWEYGVEVEGEVAVRPKAIAERACASADYATLVRRRPAGPWLPVEGEKP